MTLGVTIDWLRSTAGVRCVLAALLVVAPLATLAVVPTSAATKGCSVKNEATGRTYSTLQAAVDAARPRQTLFLSGTCRGGTVIVKNLTIVGSRTGRTGIPTLTGDHRHRVLNIRRGVTARLSGLQVIHGRAIRGAGIRNAGTLVLRDVIVRRNDTGEFGRGSGIWGGAGVWNTGRLSLNGTTRITGNWTYGWGAGVMNAGRLTMNGASIVSRNTPTYGLPGGVYNRRGAVMTMNGTSSVRNNGQWQVDNEGQLTLNDTSWIKPEPGEGAFGAGVRNFGRLTMNDASTIRDGHDMSNGVENYGRFVMTGSSSIRNNPGGGVSNLQEGRRVGLVTMRDHSSIRDNTGACAGAGVYNEATFRMTDASSVTGNALIDYGWGDCHLSRGGGGIYQAGGSLVGVRCAPEANPNVHGNTPDDCYIAE